MTVESATYVADLQNTQPAATDLRSQGDDHLRLIKSVLQTTFPGASRTSPVPSTLTKSGNYSVVKNDGNSTLYVSTGGGAVSITLPTLAALDQGWYIDIVKTSTDANPILVKPPSGTLNSGGIGGLSAARRAIPGVACRAIWDGSSFFVTRCLALPIASIIDHYGGNGSPEPGYEWANGQTLSSASTNYPEYNNRIGSGGTPDLRGFTVIGRDNMGGVAAGRVGSVINGNSVGNNAGSEVVTLTNLQIPPHQHSGSTSTESAFHTHNYTTRNAVSVGANTGLPGYFLNDATFTTGNQNSLHNHTFTTNLDGGAGNGHSNLQPSFVLNKLIVVE